VGFSWIGGHDDGVAALSAASDSSTATATAFAFEFEFEFDKLVCEVSWGDRENMDDRNSKMKRQRKAMERMATLRLHVNWVLDLMLGF